MDNNSYIEKWSSLEDMTEHLGVSRESILQWISKKGLPAHKLGRLWKFKISEVDEWVRSGGAADRERSIGGEEN